MITGKEFAVLNKKEGIVSIETEVEKGSREPEPPQAPLSVSVPAEAVTAPDKTPKSNARELRNQRRRELAYVK